MSDAHASALGKKLLGFFVETEETNEAPTAKPAIPVSAVVPTAKAASSVDQEMLASLQKKIHARSSPYITLIEAAQRMSGVIPDESTRIKAAYTMVSADGTRSLSSIMQAIDVHIADLEGERLRFRNASDEQTSRKSAAMRDQARNLEEQNAENAAQIQRLQADVAKLQTAIATNAAQSRELKQEADSADGEIKRVSIAFDVAVDFLKRDLAAKKNSLTTILS